MSSGLSQLAGGSASPDNTPIVKHETDEKAVFLSKEHSVSLQKEIDQYEQLNEEARVLEDLQKMDLLPLLLDVVESLKAGKISPKDFDNAVIAIEPDRRAGRIDGKPDRQDGAAQGADRREEEAAGTDQQRHPDQVPCL
ncbi:hypothetical protein OGAPHI_004015 [Ogataea philodendri]|uniref:Uncharacterized protein n=1 Tax=Ogataea philodendri TaxID=1378263 RepID=A0A9P8P5V5_9ASCO|nr:uncharacterized protein OGAPHI_004015 [Ogataea philodendri]KAH3665827.1 hypothetical protein OGAPHI_004015 [Ogataea philodendri]